MRDRGDSDKGTEIEENNQHPRNFGPVTPGIPIQTWRDQEENEKEVAGKKEDSLKAGQKKRVTFEVVEGSSKQERRKGLTGQKKKPGLVKSNSKKSRRNVYSPMSETDSDEKETEIQKS